MTFTLLNKNNTLSRNIRCQSPSEIASCPEGGSLHLSKPKNSQVELFLSEQLHKLYFTIMFYDE